MSEISMSDHEAFMRTICAMPDEDLPRLVYADWLEENRHESLAEFIRVQIELFRMGHLESTFFGMSRGSDGKLYPKNESDPRKAALLVLEAASFEKRVQWRRLPPRWVGLGIEAYRRSFLEFWGGTVSEFLKYGEELCLTDRSEN